MVRQKLKRYDSKFLQSLNLSNLEQPPKSSLVYVKYTTLNKIYSRHKYEANSADSGANAKEISCKMSH